MTANHELPEGYALGETRWTDLNPVQQQNVLKILDDGRAVSVASAKLELPKVATLVLLQHHEVIVGMGTIKQERIWYAKDVQSAQKSGHAFDPKMRELGYVVVHNDHQNKKLSGHIANALLARHDGPLFATTDAQTMKYALGNRGFTRHGREWKGQRGTLSLWLRDGKPKV